MVGLTARSVLSPPHYQPALLEEGDIRHQTTLTHQVTTILKYLYFVFSQADDSLDFNYDKSEGHLRWLLCRQAAGSLQEYKGEGSNLLIICPIEVEMIFAPSTSSLLQAAGCSHHPACLKKKDGNENRKEPR